MSILTSIDDFIINTLESKYKLKLEKSCFSKGWIPNYLILDKTRNIHSYVTFFFLENHKLYTETSFIPDINEVCKELYKIKFSTLQRPLFIIIEEENNLKMVEIDDFKENIIKNEIITINNLKAKLIDCELIIPLIKNER